MPTEKPILVRPVDLLNMSCSNADAGHPVSNLADHKAIGLTWRTDDAGSIFVRGEFDGTRNIDHCAVLAANATASTQIRLRLGTSQSEVDGGSAQYDSGAVDFISPAVTREGGLYHSHQTLPDTEAATHFRIDITGHSGDFEAAHLVLGPVIEPSRFYNWDFELGVEDLGRGEFTPWGVFDEEEGLVLRKLAFTLGWLTQSEFESSFRKLAEYSGKREFVYCCFDPEATAYRQDKTYFGPFDRAPFARGTRKPGYTMDLSMVSVI